jgi:hypothetical protein
LYLSKGAISSDGEISAVLTNINSAQTRLGKIDENIETAEKDKDKNLDFVRSVSEKIGSTKSKEDYERQRKNLKSQRDLFLRNAEEAQGGFGDDVLDMFPQLLISKAVEDAKKKINLEISKNKLPSGISIKLISYLLQDSTAECICGKPLCAESRTHIEKFKAMLPPNNYSNLFNEFASTARMWGKGFDKDKVERHIKSVLDNIELAESCDTQIQELDEIEKKSPDIEDLVVARQTAEGEIKDLDTRISELKTEKKKVEIYLKKRMETYDELTEATKSGIAVQEKISIMYQVLDYFKKKLEDESVGYSQKLEENIQLLIDNMLTSKRSVYVSPEFSVIVTDSFNDESKSEGQFAVVSFAYIGGILRMLQSVESLSQKEYPLVLDGPFSKLDPDQRQNVINMIPKFAPQVILFSKDDLQSVFPAENIGRVWTIVSNAEKNIARIEEGYLWK